MAFFRDPDSNLLGGISTLSRLRSFGLGVLNLADTAYFVVAAVAAMAIATWAVEHARRYA